MSLPSESIPWPTIVIVAYGHPGPLEDCLAALDPALPTIVVDNSSSPTTKEIVDCHGGTYIDPKRNLGFAAGVNLALGQVEPNHDVLLLNPDAVIPTEDILELQRRLHADPFLACVAPAQIDPESGTSARVTWPTPTPIGACMEAVGLGRRRRGRTFVIGSVLLLRAGAVQQVGPLDERFFLYAEETDWQMRAMNLGWRVKECPSVVATHVGAGTGGDPIRREIHFHASHERLIRKHFGASGWLAYRAASTAGAAVRAVAPSPGRRARARFRMRLYLLGPCAVESRRDAGTE